MADQVPNGTVLPNVDIDMKEEAPVEAPMSSIQQSPQADVTDPNPRPPAATVAASQPLVVAPEQLSIIQSTVQSAAPALAASSASSARPGSLPPPPSARPEKPVAHGGPTRQFLNQNITPHLLEGMKYLAIYEPEKPLLWLADFLRDRSKEVEA